MDDNEDKAGFGTGLGVGVVFGLFLAIVISFFTGTQANKNSDQYLQQTCDGERYQVKEHGDEYTLYCMKEEDASG